MLLLAAGPDLLLRTGAGSPWLIHTGRGLAYSEGHAPRVHLNQRQNCFNPLIHHTNSACNGKVHDQPPMACTSPRSMASAISALTAASAVMED
jgi:hypothetical protein